MEKLEDVLSFLKTLPLEVALVVWDVLNGNISPLTKAIADSYENFYDYEILGAVVGGNLEQKEALTEYCRELVIEMYAQYREGIK